MSYTTFNGANIIPMPSLGFRDIALTMNDTVGMVQSPFTKQQQTQYWAGGDFWEAQVDLPPMSDAAAKPWFAFLASLRGQQNIFYLADPMGLTPAGVVTVTTCQILGNAPSGSYSIGLKGLAPVSTTGVLLPGDYIQIGYRLHKIAGVTPIDTDSSGEATSIEIWPSIREAQVDGNPVTINPAYGLFRLADNKRAWSATAQDHLWAISFKATEVR